MLSLKRATLEKGGMDFWDDPTFLFPVFSVIMAITVITVLVKWGLHGMHPFVCVHWSWDTFVSFLYLVSDYILTLYLSRRQTIAFARRLGWLNILDRNTSIKDGLGHSVHQPIDWEPLDSCDDMKYKMWLLSNDIVMTIYELYEYTSFLHYYWITALVSQYVIATPSIISQSYNNSNIYSNT